MNNIIDSVKWRGDLTFDQAPLCPVDFLIFAQLVHLPLENLRGQGLGERLCDLEGRVYSAAPAKDENTLIRSRYELWQALRDTPRFGDVRLARFASHFDVEAEKQFAAAVFRCGDVSIAAFRGTDATLVGWKEDFNMGFEIPVPSQTEAVAFLTDNAALTDTWYTCGHSKGGNLAMYAAAMCSPEVRKKIRGVYSFDGPGMDQRTLQSPGWQELSIHSYIPESSIIGLLLGYREDFTIIESDSVSIMQHNPYHWHVLGPGFVTAQETTLSSQFTDKTLHNFLDNCTVEQRKTMINALYSVLAASGATRLRDLPKGLMTHLDDVAAALAAISPEERQAVGGALKLLASAGGENMRLLAGSLLSRFSPEAKKD